MKILCKIDAWANMNALIQILSLWHIRKQWHNTSQYSKTYYSEKCSKITQKNNFQSSRIQAQLHAPRICRWLHDAMSATNGTISSFLGEHAQKLRITKQANEIMGKDFVEEYDYNVKRVPLLKMLWKEIPNKNAGSTVHFWKDLFRVYLQMI